MAQPAKFDVSRAIFIGLVIPVLVTAIDGWLLSRELYPGREIAGARAMAGFVLQVGAFGVLCGRFIEPGWFRWLLFGWCMLITDLNAAASLSSQISPSLYTAQVGLVVMWIVLGASSWKIRMPAALIVAIPALVLIVQTATLCLICLVLRSQGFRLNRTDGDSDGQLSALSGQSTSRPIQFGIRDVLLWTTALSPLLALSRLGIGTTLVNGVLHAVVLVVALWSALGQGPYWLRWPLLAVFGLLAGLIWADFHIYVFHWWSFFGGPPPWFSLGHLDIWYWQWYEMLPFILAGAMLSATLLIFRVLGYRLCREQRFSAMNQEQPQQP